MPNDTNTEREATYTEAIHDAACGKHDCDICIRYPEAVEAARAVMAVADAEQAELRAEVERLRAWDSHGGEDCDEIDEQLAEAKGWVNFSGKKATEFYDRAEAAEAELAALRGRIEALADEWQRNESLSADYQDGLADAAEQVRAAIAAPHAGVATSYPPPCHPSCVLGPDRDHPGYLEYRCIDEDVNALPFPSEEGP